MITRNAAYFFLCCLFPMSLQAQKSDGFSFVDHFDKNQVDILYNNKLLTSYCYGDSIMKPVLFPVNTVSGITVTRGFPLSPRPGERVDHPHHIGIWMNYESVNGLDFWNNSIAIPYQNKSRYGRIVHHKIVTAETKGNNKATLVTAAYWKDHSNRTLLTEITTYSFEVRKTDFIIDRITGLTAVANEVLFRDIKDGFLAIRVARELEHSSSEPATLIDKNGGYTSTPVVNNDGVTGEYLSSEGLTGNAVWGTRAKWTSLRGKIRQQPVSITILDHPKNPGYPTYWHARGYGLFAANPLGQAIFSNGKEQLNLSIKKDESVIFRYRIIVRGGHDITAEEINKLAKDFSK